MSVRPTWRVVPFLLAAALSGGCDRRDGAADHTTVGSSALDVVDADGRRVRLDGPARRIVSLVPSATETLRALGAGDLVVARTDFDTVAWARELPSVGGGLEPSIEAIVAARPDLVIRFGGPQDPRTPSRLDDLGIIHLAIRPDRVADVFESISLLGAVTGHDGAAESLTSAIRDTLDNVRARSSGGPPVRVAYVLGGTPPWVAGPDTYIDELIHLAGGVNVFADLGARYASVSPEEFVARDIDVVLTPPDGRFERRWAPNARLVQMGPAMELPGPAVMEAAREVERALHPGGGS